MKKWGTAVVATLVFALVLLEVGLSYKEFRRQAEVSLYCDASMKRGAEALVKIAGRHLNGGDQIFYRARLRELCVRPIADRMDKWILGVGDSYEDVAADTVAQLRKNGVQDPQVEELWAALWRVRLLATTAKVDEFEGMILSGGKPIERCSYKELDALRRTQFAQAKMDFDRILVEVEEAKVTVAR